MKKLSYLIIFVLLLTACDNSSSKTSSPVSPGLPSEPDYSAIEIISFELFYDGTRVYYLGEVKNNSGYDFKNLYYDATNIFDVFDDTFDLGPYSTVIIGDNKHGPLTSITDTTLETELLIYTEPGGDLVTSAYDSIVI